MAEQYLGEIRIFAGYYAPRDWGFCDGQIISVTDNQALASLLNSIYGGNGYNTFGLPDMRGRLPVHQGAGAGLTPRPIGQRFGVEKAPLDVSQIGPHTHAMMASDNDGIDQNPANLVMAKCSVNTYASQVTDNQMRSFEHSLVEPTGIEQTEVKHYNIMPCLCLSFIIAMKGTYPQRS